MEFGFEQASNQLSTSFEPASVMEFSFLVDTGMFTEKDDYTEYTSSTALLQLLSTAPTFFRTVVQTAS